MILQQSLLNATQQGNISVFSPNTGKYGPEKTPYLDTFLAVLLIPVYTTIKKF